MSYRFVKVASFYDRYLDDYYQRHPDESQYSYQTQLDRLLSGGFAWSDIFARNLKPHGIDAYEIVCNAEPLQRAWARESNGTNDLQQITFEQIKALRPDILFLQDPFDFDAKWVAHLKDQVPSIKKVFAWCCAPFSKSQIPYLRSLDGVLTCTPGFVDNFHKEGICAHLCIHAFDSYYLPKLQEENPFPESDFLFIGSVVALQGHHEERIQLLEKLVQSNVDLSIYGSLAAEVDLKLKAKQALYLYTKLLQHTPLVQSLLPHLPVLKSTSKWEEFPWQAKVSSQLKQRFQSPQFGLQMLQALSRSKIGFNAHIGVAGRYAGNMRLFETTGVGACLVTDWKENMPQLFSENEAVTYQSLDECVEKVTWLLEHPEERAAIAKAGQQRTLKEHCWEKRILEVHDIFLKSLAS